MAEEVDLKSRVTNTDLYDSWLRKSVPKQMIPALYIGRSKQEYFFQFIDWGPDTSEI